MNDSESAERINEFSIMPSNLNSAFANFSISTGGFLVMSPVESGKCINKSEKNKYSLLRDDMMTTSSGQLLSLPNGDYNCYYDEIEIEQGEARRCHIVKVNNSPYAAELLMRVGFTLFQSLSEVERAGFNLNEMSVCVR